MHKHYHYNTIKPYNNNKLAKYNKFSDNGDNNIKQVYILSDSCHSYKC